MKSLRKNLVGKKDSPEVRAILKSTPLKIDDPEVWADTQSCNEEFPWDEGMRFAERLGVMAQHLSERCGVPVKDIAPQAFALADDKDIKNIDTEWGLYVFVYAVDALDKSTAFGKDLKEWCLLEDPRLIPIFDALELVKANDEYPDLLKVENSTSDEDGLGEDSDDDEPVDPDDLMGLRLEAGSVSSKEYYRLYLDAESVFNKEIHKAFNAAGYKNNDLELFLLQKHVISLYLYTDIKEGASEKLKKELRNYLAQPCDNLAGAPTSNDRWNRQILRPVRSPPNGATNSKAPVWSGYFAPT